MLRFIDDPWNSLHYLPTFSPFFNDAEDCFIFFSECEHQKAMGEDETFPATARSLLFGHFAHGTAYFIILSWTPTYFHDNFPQAKNWVFNVVPWVVAFPSSLLSGYLSDWLLVQQYEVTLVRKFMESLSLLGTAFFLLMLAFTNNYLVSLFSMAMAVGFGSCHQAGIALNALDIAPNAGGSVFGILNMAGSLPGFVGVYMAGYILEITRSWSAVFLQTAGVCIFGWIFYTCYGTTERLV